MSDLRALLIGIVGGIISYYAAKGIDFYLSRRPTRSRQSQIKQLTQELQLLEKLGLTDRALLLHALTALFGLIAVAAGGIAGSMVFLSSHPRHDPTWLILFLVPVVIALVAFGISRRFRKLQDPEPTLAKLRQKLRDLQGKDDQLPKG